MIQFLQPIGLWAMAGVLIPVIVHLWNDRRGKVLRIGSVALMAGASRRAAWSVRLTQLWLLVLRCLLVIALAVLLAGPYRMRSPRDGGKGWVLMAGAGEQAVVDSLVKAGYERHVLDTTINYFEALRRMERLAPEGMPFLVLTPNLVSRFAGARYATDRKIDWELYSPADSVSRWIEDVWRSSADSISVLRGISRSTGTEFRRERVASAGAAYEGLVVDTAALEVVVVGGSRQEGDYMRAALTALGEYTGRRLRVVPAGPANARVIRWQPEWSEAAWNGQLPVVLGRLLLEHGGRGNMDRRGIDLQQLAPEQLGYYAVKSGVEPFGLGEAGSGVAQQRVDLRPLVWAIVFVLFVLERIKAIRDARQKT